MFKAEPSGGAATPPPAPASAPSSANAGPGKRWDDEERPRRQADDDSFHDKIPIRRSGVPHRGGLILVLGIVALVFFPCTTPVCGPIAWVMGNADLIEMRAGRMDPEGEGLTNAGRILGMMSTGISLLGVAFMCFIFALAALAG